MKFAARILSVALISPQISALAAKCFLPNGNRDDNDQPCFENDTLSRCCAPDEVCSTNKLCVNAKNSGTKFARGSCLDENFGGTCPNFCKGIKDSGKVDVYQCGDPSLGQFCCDEGRGLGSSCCSTLSNIITLGIGSTFSEGASATIMVAMSNPPVFVTLPSIITQTTIFPQTRSSLQFVTSIISSAQIRSSLAIISSAQIRSSLAPSSSRIVVSSSVARQTLTSVISLASSRIIPSSTISHIPTTIPDGFTNLPSPVFTSVFVPTPTPPPQRSTTRSIITTIRPSSTVVASTPSSTSLSTTAPIAMQMSPTSGTALSATASLISSPKPPNSQAIIAGTVGVAVAVFLITFFIILFRQQRKRQEPPQNKAVTPGNFGADEKGSIRSVQTDSSVQTAFGYKPQPKRNDSERSDDNNISVPIVFRSDTPYDSVISADIRSIEERIQRMSGTTYRSAGVKSTENRRMTPGSDFNVNIYQSPRVLSPTTSRLREELERPESYVDERELQSFGYTPEDLNRVGGTGYGKGIVPMELSGMEQRIPDRISGLSERSTTYQKLMYDVKSQPF